MIDLKGFWDFLDVFDKNLLYEYAQVLTGRKKQIRFMSQNVITEYEEMEQAEKKKKKAYYLIWFVYRYILRCKTLDEAMQYANTETLTKFRLSSYVLNATIYIGNGLDKELCFRKIEDIEMILEILYNRYDFFEQLDCFQRHTIKYRQKKCLSVIEKYQEIYDYYEKKKPQEENNETEDIQNEIKNT